MVGAVEVGQCGANSGGFPESAVRPLLSPEKTVLGKGRGTVGVAGMVAGMGVRRDGLPDELRLGHEVVEVPDGAGAVVLDRDGGPRPDAEAVGADDDRLGAGAVADALDRDPDLLFGHGDAEPRALHQPLELHLAGMEGDGWRGERTRLGPTDSTGGHNGRGGGGAKEQAPSARIGAVLGRSERSHPATSASP